LEEKVKELEQEALAEGNIKDTFQMLIEKGLNRELGKGRSKVVKRKRNERSHLDPPHADVDCLMSEVEKREESDLVINFEGEDCYFVEVSNQKEVKKRRVALSLPEEADSWSVSRQIEWLSAHPNLDS
jgi:hypothetical protein